MSNISNIDELLMGVGNSQQPATPEHKEKIEAEKEPIEKAETEEVPQYEDEPKEDIAPEVEAESETDDESDTLEKPEKEAAVDEDELDDYGNPKERMSKGMKERLDRKEKQHQREMEQRDRELQALRQQLAQQGASKEVQQAAKDFKYDPNDENTWEKQLTDFVKTTVNNMQHEEQRKIREAQDQEAQQKFREKFQEGMGKFDDFREVVGAQPIDDAMTLALRGMANPAAFIYAASKRNPEELQRISKLSDPYARMVEMGKLEERMRRNKPTTKAPKPLGRTKEDVSVKVVPKQKEPTGDDLLAKADAKRLSVVKNRHRANR